MSTYLLGGFVAANLGIALIRIVLGLFFILARFRFFYDPSAREGNKIFCPARVQSLTNKMAVCGLPKHSKQWAYFVASAEVLAGLALIVGFLAVPAALGLLIILLYATRYTCREKVEKQNPVDNIDKVGCYLWTAEPLYISMALFIVLVGAGAYSLDALIFS